MGLYNTQSGTNCGLSSSPLPSPFYSIILSRILGIVSATSPSLRWLLDGLAHCINTACTRFQFPLQCPFPQNQSGKENPSALALTGPPPLHSRCLPQLLGPNSPPHSSISSKTRLNVSPTFNATRQRFHSCLIRHTVSISTLLTSSSCSTLQPVVREETSSWRRVTKLWSMANADLSLSALPLSTCPSAGLCAFVVVGLDIADKGWE